MKLIKLNAIDSTNEYIKLNKSFFSQKFISSLFFQPDKWQRSERKKVDN